MKVKQQFSQAYDEYAPSILRHIYFRVSDRDVAKDLTQETFFRAWQYIVSQNIDIKIRSFKAFFYKIANNLVIDYYRQKSNRPISLENVEEKELIVESEQEQEFEASLLLRLVMENLSKLKDDHRQIILYRYVDGLSNQEIGYICGKSAVNVRVIIHRSLKILRKIIGEQTE